MDGHQVTLAAEAVTAVTVTAEDGVTTATYRVAVSRAEAPQLVSATVDATELVLVYSEDLDADSRPAGGDFAVSVTDALDLSTTRNVTDVTIDGPRVILTLSAAVSHGDTVTLTYKPGEDPVQDLAGLDAAVLEDSAVTNNTVAALAALGSLARPMLERLWVPETRPWSLSCRGAGRC